MRGYFGIGVEGINKVMNVGNLFRTAHAFGASFVFTVAATYDREEGARSDTSDSLGHVPFYSFPDLPSIQLPEKCALVGIELTPDAVELPSFRHPSRAAYILGPERGSISPELTERCDHIIKIPTSDRKSTRLNSSHRCISYAVFCLKKKNQHQTGYYHSNIHPHCL